MQRTTKERKDADKFTAGLVAVFCVLSFPVLSNGTLSQSARPVVTHEAMRGTVKVVKLRKKTFSKLFSFLSVRSVFDRGDGSSVRCWGRQLANNCKSTLRACEVLSHVHTCGALDHASSWKMIKRCKKSYSSCMCCVQPPDCGEIWDNTRSVCT